MYTTKPMNFGNSIQSVLSHASHIRVDDYWYPVLGYDTMYDTVCLENYSETGIVIEEASRLISPEDIQVACEILVEEG